MKIIVSIIISFMYLLGTMPVFVSFHYCGDHFQYVTVNKVEEKKSCCGENESPTNGCCSNKTVSFDVDDQVNAKVLLTLKVPKISVAGTNFYHLPERKSTSYLHEVFEISHSPPLCSNLRLHLLNCVFLI